MAKQQKKSKPKPTPLPTLPARAPSPFPPPPPLWVAPEVDLQPPTMLRPVVIDQRLLFTVIAIAVGCGLLWLVRDTLVTLVFVGVVTFMGAPLVARLEAAGVPRSVGAGLFLAGIVGVVVCLVALVFPPLVDDFIVLIARLPALLTKSVDLIFKYTGVVVPLRMKDFSTEASKDLLEQLSPMAEKGGTLVGQGAMGLARGAASAAGFIAEAVMVPVIAFFVLTELRDIKAYCANSLPMPVRMLSRRYTPLVNEALSGLIRGQLTVVAFMSVFYVVGLSISGVPLAIGVGIIAGIANLVPFASSSVALVLSIAFILLEPGDADITRPLVGALITCAVVQVLESYVLTPRIVGEKAGLSPLAALLAVLLGGSAAGLLGVIFALPVAAVVALVMREEVLHRRAVLQNDADGLQGEELAEVR